MKLIVRNLSFKGKDNSLKYRFFSVKILLKLHYNLRLFTRMALCRGITPPQQPLPASPKGRG